VFRDWRPIQGLGPGGGLWWPEVRAGRLKDALASENDRIAIYQYINPTEASRGLLHCLFWQNAQFQLLSASAHFTFRQLAFETLCFASRGRVFRSDQAAAVRTQLSRFAGSFLLLN
jgi:hypothetical protein